MAERAERYCDPAVTDDHVAEGTGQFRSLLVPFEMRGGSF